MSYRRRISLAAGMAFWVLACFAREASMASETKRVLLLYHSFATNLVYAKAIRAELDRQKPNSLEIYDAPLLPGSSESVADRYADYLQARFGDQKVALVIAIGVDAMNLFRRYRNQIFPSSALLALLEERRIPRSNLTKNEGAIGGSTDFTAIMDSILQVLPDTANVAVVIGNSVAEKYWLEQMSVAFEPFAGRVSFVWFNDLSLDEMMNHAASLPPRSAIFFYSLLNDGAGAVHEEDVVLSQLHSRANPPFSPGTMRTSAMALWVARLSASRTEPRR